MAETEPVNGDDWCVSAGDLVVRLADSQEEVEAALELRYRVFYQEMAAKASPEMEARGHDFDAYDEIADHLLVIDHSVGRGAKGVVGTYRLIRRQAAERLGHFYSADEFDITKLLAYPGEMLELGRSCVGSDYRTGRTMQLLWRGITAYIVQHDIGLMFGCASLPGTDPDQLALPLSYLHHYHLAPLALRPRALEHRYTEMGRMPPDEINQKLAMARIPPLIKGYLRLGGFVGDGAVIDDQFATTDVCVVVKTDLITERYYRYYRYYEPDRLPVLVYPSG